MPGVTELYLNLASPLTAPSLFDATITESTATSIWDRSQNDYPDATMRRITDVLIGAIEPVWATDGIQPDNRNRAGFSTLRKFDGTERLHDFDITVESSILSTDNAHISLSVNMYFDVDVPDSRRTEAGIGFWSVFEIPGLIEQPNASARQGQLLRDSGNITQHKVPSADEEIKSGVTLEFLYSVGDRMAAWTDNPNNPLGLKPWSVKIGVVQQRGDATILNNVINPAAGDRAVLHYELKRPGQVVVNVLTVDGDLVKVLRRTRAGEGPYTLFWDGTNTLGDIVARGFYLIRIVGPDIDEVRKVLVVKR